MSDRDTDHVVLATRVAEYRAIARIAEAEHEGWLGEVEGLRVSLAGAERKLSQIDRACSNGRLQIA